MATTTTTPTTDKANMGKYERMKKLGMPTPSIINRMRMDGVDPAIIEQWSGVSTASKDSKSDPSQSSADIMTTKPKSTTTMKPFHWAKFTKMQVENTLWKQSDKTLSHYKIDYPLLEDKFSRNTDQDKSNTTTATSSSDKPDTKQDTTGKENEADKNDSILDSRRIQNVMIGLARIGLDDNEILEAILNLDDTKLPPDKVQHLIPCAPTDGELEMVRAYVKSGGDVSKLSGAEKFFVKLMDLVSVKQMLKLWLLKSQFEPRVKHIRDRIQLVESTLLALRNSENLRQMLEVILAVGNFLNYGTSRGNAYGFHLEPTLDMVDGLKANDKTISLLGFIVEQIQIAAPDALRWVEEFEVLAEASKVGSSSLQSDVEELQRDIQELEKRVKAHRRTMTKTHSDWAREGVSIGLQHVASHIRHVSRLPKALQMAELSNYGTLRAPLKESTTTTTTEKDKDEEKEENQFSISMLRFYKRENTTVRQVDTELKKLELECKQTMAYFGCDEDTKWEELFGILLNFRERFMKAQREIEAGVKRKERQEKQLQKKQELDAKLKQRPKPPAYSAGSEDANSNESAKATTAQSAQQQKTFDMYAQYQKMKRGQQNSGNSGAEF